MNLSEKQAYLAMFYYLDAYYDRTKSNEVGSLLGDMSLLEDGFPADPAVWDDWRDAIQKALKEIPTKK